MDHGEYKIGRQYKNHYKAYENVMKDKLFYPKTTSKYKQFIKNKYADTYTINGLGNRIILWGAE